MKTILKRLLGLVLTVCLCLVMLSGMTIDVEAASNYNESELGNIKSSIISNSSRASYVQDMMKYHILSSTDNYRVARNLKDGKSVVFFFDGCSDNVDDPTYGNYLKYHLSAYCAVVQEANGALKVVYESEYCSTIPDNPRNATLNDNTAVPTVLDGVYNITSINHLGKYAALHISNNSGVAPAIRCNTTSSYVDSSTAINIHARSKFSGVAHNGIGANTYSSTGCFNVGRTDDSWADYNNFIYAVLGVSNARNVTLSSTGVDKGLVVVDRSQYKSQLAAIYGSDNNHSAERLVAKITEYTDNLGYSAKFFDFWGCEDNITVNGVHKFWFKQEGYGSCDVNLDLDGKALGTIYQDSNGLFSYELDTRQYLNGTHKLGAIIRSTDGSEKYVTRTINIDNKNLPVGVLDSVIADTQKVHVVGWAYDRDDLSRSVRIHVYIGDKMIGNGFAKLHRPDLNTNANHLGVGEYHGYAFDCEIPSGLTGKQTVTVYAIDDETVNNPALGNATVDILADTEKPVISDVTITNITEDGYTVSCKVTDNTGVNRVQFPTWTEPKQDDLNQNWGDSESCSGTKNGDIYTYRVKFSDHNNEKARYITHIYAYDNYGNENFEGCGEVSAQYTVSFNANGGTGAPASQTKTHDVTLTLSSTKPTRSLYNFKGWATSSTAATAVYQAGGAFTANANTTLYAVWEHVCANGHSYSYGVSTAPTTSATGALAGTCSKCSGTTTVTLPKLNTSDYTYQVVTAATCTADGTARYTWKTTAYGSYYFDVVTAKTGHSYQSIVTAPTCTAQGYTTHTCSTCGDNYKDSYTTALGHGYSYEVSKAPTISAEGSLTGICSGCSEITTVTLPKLNTTDYAYQVITAATCTADGTGRYTWNTTTYGSYYFDVVLDQTDHAYQSVVTAPTCTEQGYTTYACSSCGDSYTDTYVDALGHTEVIDEAVFSGCNEPYLTEGSHCSVCGEVLIAQVYQPATGHDYRSGVCIYCGETDPDYSTTNKIASGWSGDLTWVLTDDGVLTFSGTGAMKNYGYKSEMPWYKYIDQITSVVINEGATRIGDYAFYGMTKLETIDIADTVTYIGDFSFKGSTALDGVVLPPNLSNLGTSAFYGCTGLTSIEIPASLYTVKPYAFKNCSSLAEVTFHEGNLMKLSDGSFYGTALTEVEFPTCLDIIDVYCFKNCFDLASITIPQGDLTQIREAVFYATAIPSITIPEGVTKVGPYAFKNCVNLKTVSLPTTLTSVGEASFYACTGLQGITIPDAVTSIGDYAFRKCAAMTEVNLGRELADIGLCAFYGCSGLTDLEIPDKVTTIQGYAFKGCTGLTSVNLGSSVETLGESAFHTCTALKTLEMPASLKTIGDYCFSGSYNLWQLTFTGNAPSIGSGAFKGMDAYAYYPANDSTWTSAVMQNYGGDITWKVVGEEEPDDTVYVAEGTCGANATWTLDENGVLTVTGTGAMDEYSNTSKVPWAAYRSDINTVVINDGITEVGFNCFWKCINLENITIADSVTTLGKYAFAYSNKLESVVVPEGVTTFADSVFNGCNTNS